MIKKPELLAPAGSFEKAKVAFMYGADAVYCGTGELSLRSRSPINEEELAKIINYAHSIGKRVHVTLNTYASDDLYDAMEKQIRLLDKLKVDAIIAADGGVIQLIHDIAPNIEIHISTQANTLSAHTAKFWQKNGASRVILSREMNKEDIKKVIDNIPESIYYSVTGLFPEGGLPFNQENCLTPIEVLESWTSGGAYDFYREKDLGSITVGKLADLTVIDGDILHTDPIDCRELEVYMTIVNGRIVFQK